MSVRRLVLLGSTLSVACVMTGPPGTGDYAPPVQLGDPQAGIITGYEATGAGNCSFDPSPDDLDVAAMNAEEYAGSAVCGACARVDGPLGSVTVRIVDQCPECARGHLDLSHEAFAKVADPQLGRVDVSWQLVSCPVTGPMRFRYKEGSSAFWTAIQVRNHRLPIRSLEIEKNGSFERIERESYNYFVDPKGAGGLPITVRVTAMDDQRRTEILPPPKDSLEVPGVFQFD